MHESFDVSTSDGSYSVTVGRNVLAQLESSNQVVFLIDAYFAQRLARHKDRTICIPALEASKNLNYISTVIEKMRALEVNRGTHMYAIGGGVIQDVATFVSSIYMRGLSWTYCPSTLLGMADSCIGGKSSINVGGYKNLVGNIYPPTAVFVDVDFCETLKPQDVVGGLVEAVKICYARDHQTFHQYLALNAQFPMTKESSIAVINLALLAKKWFIEIDEFDKSERLLLNFGHTFGHALEAATNFALAHGVAVGLGILVAIEYSNINLMLDKRGLVLTQQLRNYLNQLLSPLRLDLLNIVSAIDLKKVMEKFDSDKKHSHTDYRMVVPVANGGLSLISSTKDQGSKDLILSAYRQAFLLNGYTNINNQSNH